MPPSGRLLNLPSASCDFDFYLLKPNIDRFMPVSRGPLSSLLLSDTTDVFNRQHNECDWQMDRQADKTAIYHALATVNSLLIATLPNNTWLTENKLLTSSGTARFYHVGPVRLNFNSCCRPCLYRHAGECGQAIYGQLSHPVTCIICMSGQPQVICEGTRPTANMWPTDSIDMRRAVRRRPDVRHERCHIWRCTSAHFPRRGDARRPVWAAS